MSNYCLKKTLICRFSDVEKWKIFKCYSAYKTKYTNSKVKLRFKVPKLCKSCLCSLDEQYAINFFQLWKGFLCNILEKSQFSFN